MKNKRAVMGFAALLILIFHFYIPFTSGKTELFLYKAAYIGVDLFFFVSAASLGRKTSIAFKPFILNRLANTYLPFVCFAAVASLYKKWSVLRFLRIAAGIEFLQKGGGAFLWFFTGIMLLYLITPFLLTVKTRFALRALAAELALWAVLVLFLQYVLHRTGIFILLNRIPIYLLGLYSDALQHNTGLSSDEKSIACLNDTKMRAILTAAGLAIGILLVWKFGTTVRLNKPIAELYYIAAIPLTLSIVSLFDFIAEYTGIRFKCLTFLGSFTLVIYSVQMIIGYDIEKRLCKIIGTTPAAFFLTALVIIFIAYLCNIVRRKCGTMQRSRKA